MYLIFLRNKKNIKKKGFTLIEALVALALFSLVLVTSVGIILSILNSNRQSQAVSVVVNNLNYSIDSMVRDIKTGYDYSCNYEDSNDINNYSIENYSSNRKTNGPCDIASTIKKITLISTITGSEGVVSYEFMPKTATENGYVKKTIYEDDVGGIKSYSYALTDRDTIDIENLYFNVKTPDTFREKQIDTTATKNPGQPGVYLLIKGKTKVNKTNISDFFIQTYISQRLPNFI